MTAQPARFWPWLLETFGTYGAVLLLLLGLLICLSWCITPISVWRLHRRSRRLEEQLQAMQDQTAQLSRQQQVERLQRDRVRKKPRRRH